MLKKIKLKDAVGTRLSHDITEIRPGEFKGPAELNVASGIVLENASVLNITGNTFSRLDTPAVMMMGNPAKKVLCQGNLLVNTEGGFEGLEESLVSANLKVED